MINPKILYTSKNTDRFFESNALINKKLDVTNLLVSLFVLIIALSVAYVNLWMGIITFIFFLSTISGCAYSFISYMYPSTKITNQPLKSIITGHVYTYHASSLSNNINNLYKLKHEEKYFSSFEYFFSIVTFIVIMIMGEKWFMSRLTK